MPKRVRYDGKAQANKGKRKGQRKVGNNSKISFESDRWTQEYYDTAEQLRTDLNLDEYGLSTEDTIYLLKSGALFDLAAELGYNSTQIEDYVEDNRDLIDVALERAKSWKRKEKFTQTDIERLHYMSDDELQAKAKRARKALEDFVDDTSIIFKL